MVYDSDKKPLELTSLTSLDDADTVIVGDSSDTDEVVKSITWANVKAALSLLYASALDAVTLTNTVTLTNKTLTAPKFADNGFIADSNGNEVVSFNSEASAVNFLEIENSATGNAVHVRARGDDTNVGLHLVPKGTGQVNISNALDETKRIRFDVSNNATGVVTVIRSNSTGTNRTLDLPNASGTLALTSDIRTLTTITSSATPTPTGDAARNELIVTALAANATIAAPTGTPAEGNMIKIIITASGGTRTVGYNAALTAGNVTRTTSVPSGETLVQIYQYQGSAWVCHYDDIN
jgi:hypothetical protein